MLASHGHGAIVKVIIETALLDDAQKDARLQAGAGCRRGFCEDFHGLQQGRRNGGRRDADAPDGGESRWA